VYVAWIVLNGGQAPSPVRTGGGACLPLLIALAASLLLAAPFLAPFAEAVTRSLRWVEVNKQTYLGVPFSDRASLVLLLQPRLYGGRPLPWGPASCETITGFAGILGIAGFAAALMSRRWRDRRFAFVIAAAIALAIIFDLKPISTPVHMLLPWIALARFRLVLCWCGAVFTAMLIDNLRKPAVLIAAAALACLFLFFHFPDRATQLASFIDAIPSIAVLIVVLIPRARPLIPVAILVELLAVNRNWNPTMPASKFYPRTPLIDALSKLDTGGSRIAGIGEPLYPNTNAMFGFADVRAHDPMENGRYDALLTRTFGYNPHDYYAKWTDPYTPLLDRLNARWIVTAPRVDLKRYQLRYDGDDGRIYENLNVWPMQRRIGNLIATSIVSYPGWRSNVGRVVTVDGLFVGVIVPPGTRDVVLRYAPASFRIGVAVSILTLLALVAASLRTSPLRPDRSTR
jgi:hypothetical protein